MSQVQVGSKVEIVNGSGEPFQATYEMGRGVIKWVGNLYGEDVAEIKFFNGLRGNWPIWMVRVVD